MTITREQAIEIARKYMPCEIGHRHFDGELDWIIAAIIEASKPIADVQAEGGEREAFEHWMVNTAKIIVGSSDPYPRGLERDYWRVWQAATVAHRQQRLYANSP